MSIDNLMMVYQKATVWERSFGLKYYDTQRQRLSVRALQRGMHPSAVVAAFAVLSPNNSEKHTYRDLDVCIGILSGELSPMTKTSAYPLNKLKALSCLQGRHPLTILKGNKVVAFYRNTMNPDDSRFVTVDGHMAGAWVGQRFLMREARITDRLYREIAEGVRTVSREVGCAAPRLQSILWLAWKRIQNAAHNPQMEFDWEGSYESDRGLCDVCEELVNPDELCGCEDCGRMYCEACSGSEDAQCADCCERGL